jgi:primosomal protein N' (replication factor Y)
MNCSVSLTYHQYRQALVCHYCGYKESLPAQCPVCTSSRILTSGYGTEKLEEELRLHFPDAGIQRMDLDSTRSKTGYEEIMNRFEHGATDILVGTQMVTKGLDFTRVSLVGVFNADRMLHFPDFRSFERGFQLLTQVSGRAGRRDKPGKVIIQTSQPGHPVLQWVLQHAYVRFYDAELNERRHYHYPPFSRLIELTVKHTDARLVREASIQLAQALRQQLTGLHIMGPGEPMISKIRNQYLMSILIKIPRDTGQLPEVKQHISEICKGLLHLKEFRSVRIIPDVDPV